jgi:hypothetical protein
VLANILESKGKALNTICTCCSVLIKGYKEYAMKFDKILPNNIWKIKKQKQDFFCFSLCILEKNKLGTFLATKHDTWSLDSFQKIKKCKEKKAKEKKCKES